MGFRVKGLGFTQPWKQSPKVNHPCETALRPEMKQIGLDMGIFFAPDAHQDSVPASASAPLHYRYGSLRAGGQFSKVKRAANANPSRLEHPQLYSPLYGGGRGGKRARTLFSLYRLFLSLAPLSLSLSLSDSLPNPNPNAIDSSLQGAKRMGRKLTTGTM